MDEFSEYELHAPDSRFQEGLDLLESDHFEEALHAFDSVLGLQPYNADAFFQRGITLIKLSNLAEAIKSFEHAIALAPAEPSFHSHCGYALLMDGKPDAALEKFEYALQLQPDGYENKVYKACALAEKRQLGEARALLEDVLFDHSDDMEVVRHYANVLGAMGHDHEALQQYSKILKIEPNNTEAIARRGSIFLRQQNHLEAIKCLREYLVLAPHDATMWVTLLETLIEMDKPSAVITVAGEAIESGIDRADVYFIRGQALLEERQFDEAIIDLRKARALEDRNSDIHFHLARAFAQRGRLKHALISINRAVQLNGRERRFLMLKARLLHELGELDQELVILDLMLDGNPNDFRMIELKVQNLLQRSLPVLACRCLDDFLMRFPTHRRALLLSAEAREQARDIVGARKRFRTLTNMADVSGTTYRGYAGFLLRQSEKVNAASILDRAARDYPEDAGIQTLRAIVHQMLNRHSDCIANLSTFIKTNHAPPEAYWLIGKSYFMVQDYSSALNSFQLARKKGAGSDTNLDAPEFKCLIAEAYSLHHLGRTAEGINLLECHGRRFDTFGQEFFEVLAELYNHVCAYSKACAVSIEGLQRYPQSPVLHYRLARCSAAIGKKRTALRHLESAIRLQPKLVQMACRDKKFHRYALSFKLNSLVNYHFFRKRGEFLGLVLLVITASLVLLRLLGGWRIIP